MATRRGRSPAQKRKRPPPARTGARLKRGEDLLRLQQTITRELAEAPGAIQGTEATLRAICDTEGWDCGELWRADPAGQGMRRFACWSVPGVAAAQRFIEMSGGHEFRRGEGLIGAVWQSGAPLWIPDAAKDPRAVRPHLSDQTGLRGALLCPLRHGGAVAGVLAFACCRIRPPDEGLLQALTAVATQLGLYLRRMDGEVRLRESEERFRSLTELSSDWFWEQDAEYRFTRMEGRNVSYGDQKLREEVLGTRCWERGLEVEGGWDSYRQRLEARARFHDVLMWRRTPEGTTRYVRISGEPVFGADGRFAGYRGTGRDVTGQKQAEESLRESEERFRRTFELAGVGVAHIGLDRRFQRVNRRFCEVLGYPEAELIGRTGRDISHPEDLDAMNQQRPRLYAGEIGEVRGEKRYLRRDGSIVWVAYTLAIERDSAGNPQYEIAVYDDISARKAAEAALRESEERFRRTFELAGSGVAHVDMQGRFLRVNRRLCEMFGYAESDLIARSVKELSHPEDRDVTDSQRASMHRGEIGVARLQKRYLRKDGSTLWVDLSVTLERDAHGSPLYEISVLDDIGARKAAEEALRESEARFRALTEMSSDFFWETDAQHRLTDMVYGRGAFGAMDEALGKAAWDLPSTHPDAAGWAALRAKVDAREPFRDFEFGRPRQGGAARFFSVSGAPRFASDSRFLGYRGVGRDITDLVLARERIASLAYHDPLTGLGNRTSLAPALEQAVERTRRRGSKLAGVFIDLDGFKQINDLHGHDAGDRLLVEAARRLRATLRSSDPVARLGGDEFFVVLEDVQSNAPAERVARKLLETLMQPYDIGSGAPVLISASIGISVFPDDAGDAATLTKHADTAMYAAKQAGKNAYRFFAAVPAANDGRTDAKEQAP